MIKLKVAEDPVVKLKFGVSFDSYPAYTGSYEVDPSHSEQTLETAGRHMTGDVVVNAINNQDKSVTPTESEQVVTYDSGYDGMDSVTVGAISSTYVGSGITRRSSSDLTASGATVSVPSGYYESSASKAVASGTAGTPSASKGSVSNHSISVTPSVTNAAGYISGGDITGTAVSVSASELVSGTKEITSNGSDIDVTNYASVDVDVPNTYSASDEGKVVDDGELVSQTSETYTVNDTYDTTTISSVTVNVAGQVINNQNKSVTPSESAQSVTADTGYTGLGTVSVGAISSSYVGSGVARKSSSDLTASGATVSVPAGYYENSASKAVQSTSLPVSAGSSPASGYVQTGTIYPDTIEQYLNIAEGYVGTDVYYKVQKMKLNSKSISANGTYNASTDDSLDGYSSVTVSVPTVTVTQDGGTGVLSIS